MMRKLEWVFLLTLVACGGSSSPKSNVTPQTPPDTPTTPSTPNSPGTNTQGEQPLGTPSPLKRGTDLWYNVAANMRRSNDTKGEVQSIGALCLQIDEVRDVATTAYKTAQETMVVARTKASSRTAEAAFYTEDLSNKNATPEAVDALLQNLWLKRLTLRSSGHGLETPKAISFRTQVAPLPSGDLTTLLFFDVRAHNQWDGWQSLDTSGNPSFLALLYNHFLQPPYSVEFFTNADKFYQHQITPLTTCGQTTDPQTCQAQGCTWATPPDGNQSACLSLFSVHLVWRETLSSPPELAGPVVHQLDTQFTQDGILFNASEIIVPDTAPTGSMPTEITGCSNKCLTANVVNAGRFADGAPCKF
jgi:hypothetical protein